MWILDQDKNSFESEIIQAGLIKNIDWLKKVIRIFLQGKIYSTNLELILQLLFNLTLQISLRNLMLVPNPATRSGKIFPQPCRWGRLSMWGIGVESGNYFFLNEKFNIIIIILKKLHKAYILREKEQFVFIQYGLRIRKKMVFNQKNYKLAQSKIYISLKKS